jgi:ribonuclease HII
MWKPPYKVELLAGVDEVGRGPLAGDVVAAAVILPAQHSIKGLADSKTITAYQREALFEEIMQQAISFSIARATVEEIDRFNILQSSLMAMRRAVRALQSQPDYVAVDGNHLPKWEYHSEAVIKGDSKVEAISAASILAKVTRDAEMQELDTIFPGYGFASNKGYPTAQHLEALQRQGPCPIHRRSFSPINNKFKPQQSKLF